jgi:hypothetical protein
MRELFDPALKTDANAKISMQDPNGEVRREAADAEHEEDRPAN